MYTYIFISLYTSNFAIHVSLIRIVHNIISLGPEYIIIYYCIIYAVYLVCTYLFLSQYKYNSL